MEEQILNEIKQLEDIILSISIIAQKSLQNF